eukprot:7051348-Pyramimonas_sp.AAC.1
MPTLAATLLNTLANRVILSQTPPRCPPCVQGQEFGQADLADDEGENVLVMVRVRPRNYRETDMKSVVRVVGSDTLFLTTPECGTSIQPQLPVQYTFDYVAGEDMDQEGLFDGE